MPIVAQVENCRLKCPNVFLGDVGDVATWIRECPVRRHVAKGCSDGLRHASCQVAQSCNVGKHEYRVPSEPAFCHLLDGEKEFTSEFGHRFLQSSVLDSFAEQIEHHSTGEVTCPRNVGLLVVLNGGPGFRKNGIEYRLRSMPLARCAGHESVIL